MPTVNENKPKNDNSVSPMRELFRKEESENANSEQKIKEENHKEDENISQNKDAELSEGSKNGPSERLSKLKVSLEKLVLALKQPSDDSYEDDDSKEKESSSDTITEKVQKKQEENAEYVIRDIFADMGQTEDTETTDEIQENIPPKSNVIYQTEEIPSDEIKEEAPPKPNKEEVNIIYQARENEIPEKEEKAYEPEQKEELSPEKTDKKESQPVEEEDPSVPKEMTAERLWNELPEYNLFDESQNDKKDNVIDLKTNIMETVKKETQKPLPKKEKPKEKKPSEYQFKIKQTIPKVPDKPVQTVPLEEPHDDKDLREGEALPIKYHCNNTQPFIVMAGKFTRTLRGEYEAIRAYHTENPTAAKTDSKQSVSSVHKANESNKEKIVKMPQKQPALKVIEPDKKPDEKTASTKKQNIPDAPAIIKKVEHMEPETEIKKPEAPKKKKKKKKQNFQFSFRDFMGSVIDEPNTDDETKTPPKKLLDDYNHEKDAEDIKTEIEKNLHMMLVRTAILLITDVLSIIAAVIAQFTPLFSEAMRTGWLFYAIISFALFTIAIISARLPIVNGLMPLRHFKANADTAAAVTALAVAIQSATALCTPYVFTNGTYHIYVPIAITALLFNSVGKLLIILRTLDNFRFLSKPYPKYAGKIYTDMKNAEKMVSEFPSKTTIIGYVKRSKFMSNFLRLSYAPDPSEELAAKIAPATTAAALLFGIAYGIMTMDFAGGVTSFALTACIGTPMMSLIALNIPMKMLCKSALNNDAMISGYGAVQQFCDTNAIMVDASQLYPTGTVTLSGMKVFRQSKLNDAMQAGAAIMYAVNGTMGYVFENIVHCTKDKLPKVESVVYEDGKGLLAWVNKQRVLVGNRTLLETHNIKVPKKELEEKYFKTGNEITYISVSGELIAMFILSYKTDREIANSLRELEENGVSFIVRTIDQNITKEKIAEKFGLFHRCITVLPTGLGNICHDVTASVDEQSRAYLVTKGKISSFARAVSGCIKMKSTTTISRILQCLGIVFGILIFTLISFVSGFQKLGSIEILIYIIFWAAATIIASLIKK